MSQTSALKSTAITNLDATPILIASPGEGGWGVSRRNEGYVTTLAGDATGSTYRLVRFPTNAKIKAVDFESAAQGAGTIDLSVYYSDSTVDGTAAAKQGLVIPTTGSQFFAAAINCASAVGITNETNQAGNNAINLRQKPMWSALGLTSDPGGYFDLVAVVGATAITTGAAILGAAVTFVM